MYKYSILVSHTAAMSSKKACAPFTRELCKISFRIIMYMINYIVQKISWFLTHFWGHLGQSIDMVETDFIFLRCDFRNKWFAFFFSWDFRLLHDLWHDLTFTVTSRKYSFYRFYHICNKSVARLAWSDCLESWRSWKSWDCCSNVALCGKFVFIYIYIYTHT